MVEVELKFEIAPTIKTLLPARLKRLGFKKFQDHVFEKTVMYDNNDHLMQTSDGRLRLRSNGKTVELSYKKPLSRKGIKREIEYETEVADQTMMEKILKAAGFHPTTSYERYRTLWIKNNIKVTIDEYPFATFLEIEGDQSTIKQVAVELGFDLKNNLTDSCDTLFTKWRIAHGLTPTPHMVFDESSR